MKKIIIPTLLVIICFILGFANLPAQVALNTAPMLQEFTPNQIIPDVMGYVNVAQLDSKGLHNFTVRVDSLPNLPGFPKHYSGTSFEGGIYCDMFGNGNLEIIYNVGYNIYALNTDGSNVPGWPVTVSPYPLEGAPAWGDIDGDGQGEVVVTSRNATSTDGYLFAYKRNGTAATGFPVNIGGTSRTPVLADLDNNGHMDIIVNKRTAPTGLEYVYRGDGTIYPGWPKALNHVPASSAAVGDIDGDGQPEIIAESYSALFAWHKNGDSIPGFPYLMPNGDVNSYSSPVLADMDGDGYREIVFGTHNLSGSGRVYILKKDGTVLSGWPKPTNEWVYGPPIVGYVNSGVMSVCIGDQIASFTPLDYVYGWDKNGNTLTGFPIGPLNAINDQVTLADINNDNQYELIFDDNTTMSGLGKYLGYTNNGTPLPGWPISTTGTTFFNTPCILDALHNNTTDILGAALEGSPANSTNIYLWNTGAGFNPSKIVNPMWQFNTRHNGVYGDVNFLGIKPISNTIPGEYKLMQNYPNPFNPSTNISFDLPKLSHVKIVLFDVLGREVSTLLDDTKPAGSYVFNWDAGNLSSGVYFYRIEAGSFTDTKKMVLVK
jgi:hypothetical protein